MFSKQFRDDKFKQLRKYKQKKESNHSSNSPDITSHRHDNKNDQSKEKNNESSDNINQFEDSLALKRYNMRKNNVTAIDQQSHLIETKLRNRLDKLMRLGTMQSKDDQLQRASEFDLSELGSMYSPEKNVMNKMNAKMMWKAFGSRVISDIRSQQQQPTSLLRQANPSPIGGVYNTETSPLSYDKHF